jgi:hypothetical protein
MFVCSHLHFRGCCSARNVLEASVEAASAVRISAAVDSDMDREVSSDPEGRGAMTNWSRNLSRFAAEASLEPSMKASFTTPRHATLDDFPRRSNAVEPQWTTLTCPNASLQAICSAAFYPADFSCAWLGWFSHSAEIGCAYGIMTAHFPWCAPCVVT